MKMGEDDNCPQFKLIFLGDQGVGKSSILNRFCQDKFTDSYQATVGLDFQSKKVTIKGTSVKLLLYDTAGQEKFRSLIPLYLRDAKIILIVYDVTVESSFTHSSFWIEVSSDDKNELIFVLIGNKIDLSEKRVIEREKGEKFALENNLLFYEVSAKTGEGIIELFNNVIIPEIGRKFSFQRNEENVNNSIIIKNKEIGQTKKKKGGCCSRSKEKKIYNTKSMENINNRKVAHEEDEEKKENEK